MADPLFGASILDELKRDQEHMADIHKTLDQLSADLSREGISFALIGAMSMRHHRFVRHTEDIDILTTREGLDRIHERLIGRGYVLRAPGLRKSLRHAGNRVDIDVIQAGEHAGSTKSPLVYPDPSSEAFFDKGGIRLPTLRTLMEIKLASGIWGGRLKDHADAQELMRANSLDENFAEQLMEELRPKYLELLHMMQREIDPETGLG